MRPGMSDFRRPEKRSLKGFQIRRLQGSEDFRVPRTHGNQDTIGVTAQMSVAVVHEPSKLVITHT